MKKVFALVIILLVFTLTFGFLGVSRDDDKENKEILSYIKEQADKQLDFTKERLVSFLSERKDNIEEEIEKEKDSVKEEAKGVFRGMWDRVTNLVFEEDIDNKGE